MSGREGRIVARSIARCRRWVDAVSQVGGGVEGLFWSLPLPQGTWKQGPGPWASRGGGDAGWRNRGGVISSSGRSQGGIKGRVELSVSVVSAGSQREMLLHLLAPAGTALVF